MKEFWNIKGWRGGKTTTWYEKIRVDKKVSSCLESSKLYLKCDTKITVLLKYGSKSIWRKYLRQLDYKYGRVKRYKER